MKASMKNNEVENKPNIINIEVGKWFMDIAKYIATAVLVAGFFGNVKEVWQMYVIGAALIALFFVLGIIIIKTKS